MDNVVLVLLNAGLFAAIVLGLTGGHIGRGGKK